MISTMLFEPGRLSVVSAGLRRPDSDAASVLHDRGTSAATAAVSTDAIVSANSEETNLLSRALYLGMCAEV